MKKILSLMALLIVMCTTVWADEVKVTWAMGESTDGVAVPATAAADIKCTAGAGLSVLDAWKWSDITFSQFQPTASDKGTNSLSSAQSMNKYVEFKFTPIGGSFTPTSVSFDIVKRGTGDPTGFATIIDGEGKEVTIGDNFTIRRNQDENVDINHSLSVSGAASSENEVALRIYIGKCANNKQVGIANVVITGEIVSSDAPVLKATEDITLKVSPLTPNKTATATIAVTGKNLTDGIYYPTVPQVDGLSISPVSYNVTDGVVNQEFTVSYAPSESTDWGDGEIEFVVGNMTTTTSFSYLARLEAYEQTIVGDAASWDWETLTEIIELNETSVPSIKDEFVFKELEDLIDFGNFDAQSIVISQTQYPSRGKKFQNGTIKFKTSKPGVVTVDFSDTGSSGDNPIKRYLRVNGVDTEYFTQRNGSSDRKVSGEIVVPAGEVSITGWNPEAKDVDGNPVEGGASAAICIYKVTFEPKETVAQTATFDFSSPNFRENIGEAMTDTKGYIYNETFTAEDATLQVTAGSAPSRIYVDGNRGQNLVTYKEYTTLTFRVPDDKTITKIEFTAAGNSNINNFKPSSGTIEGMVWTGNASGVRFQQGGTSYLANAIVTIEPTTATTEALAPIDYTECENIAAFNALAPGTYAKVNLTDAEIIGKSADGYSTVWVQDATGGAWIQYTSLNDKLQEKTKVNGAFYVVKRATSGNPQMKEAEETIISSFMAEPIEAYTVVEGGTIGEVNIPANLNKVVKIAADSILMTSATLATLYLGETETITLNNGAETANQQLHKIAEWTKGAKLENVEVVAILVAASATDASKNQLYPISIELKGETEAGEELNVERYPGMGYGTTTATVDLTAAKTFLGVDELTTNMLVVINPDGSEVTNYAAYDGWFNGEGAAETWGDNTKINVKFFQAIPEGEYTICDMNGADEIGKTYTVKWALKANGKTYTYTINVKFVEAPVVELTKSDLSIVATVEYPANCGNYQEQIVSLSDEQVANICTELGIASLADADVFGYNPSTGELLSNYVGFDGWRDANGDFAMHSGNSTVPACVKYDDGQNYYCYSIAGCEPQTIKTYWAVANSEKYVLVEIDFIYTQAQAIVREIVDLGIKTSVTYDVNEGAYTEKVASITQEQLSQILGELGLQSIEDDACEVFIYNPTTKELANDTNDGWRDANGDSHGWTGDANAPFCVKFVDGLNYSCFNLQAMSTGTTPVFWAIANDTKAVLVEIDFTYEGTIDGINAITASHSGETIYNLQGVRQSKLQKGLNIVGGKKIIVK